MTKELEIDLSGVEYRNWQSAPAEEIFPGVIKREIWRGGS